MTRHRNSAWVLPADSADGLTWSHASIAVLMDIRDELQDLNNLLRCYKFTHMPDTLKTIARNTTKRKRKA